MTSLINDLAAVTNIPKLTLSKLSNCANICITDSVLERLADHESESSIDIGIGYLHIKLENDCIKYKFVPSKELDSLICTSIQTKSNPLISALNDSLKKKIQSTYKELI